MSITHVTGATATNAGTGTTTVSVTTHTVGDVVMLGVFNDTSTITVSSVSGGGATGWARVAGPFSASVTNANLEIWAGTVSTVTTATITVTFSASVASLTVELDTDQFTAGLGSGTVWSRDGTQQAGKNNTTAATTVTYPSLTAAAAGELYFGKGIVAAGSANTTGTPSTAVFMADTFSDPYCYGLPTASGAYQPVQNISASGTSDAIGVLMKASTGTTTVNAAVTMSGAGSLTSNASATALPSATLAGAGALTAGAAPARPATATMAGAGTLSAGASNTAVSTAALSGAGALTAGASATELPTASLAGAGSLTAAAAATAFPAATLAGAGTFSVAAVDTALPTVTMAGAGALTATGNVGVNATLAGAGTLTAGASATTFPAATLAGAGTLSAAGVDSHPATATLSGAGGLSVSGTLVRPAVAAMAGVGALAAASQLTSPATTTLAGTGALVAGATSALTASAALAGAGHLTSSATGAKYVPYTPEGWTDNSLATPLSAARLNYMETGMVNIDNSQQGKAPLLVPGPVQTAAYTAQVSDLVPVDLTTQSLTVTLPTSPTDKAQVGVEIITAGTSHTCTVVTGGTDVLYKAGGATTYAMSVQGETALFEYQLSAKIWHVVSAGAPRAQLDSRYVQSVTAGNTTITVGGTATAPTIALGIVPESAVTNLVSDLAGKLTSVTAADTTVTVAGTATAPTVAVNAIAESQVTNLTTDLAAKAPLASPSFTGTVTVPHVAASGSAPTAAAGANNGTTPPAPVISGTDLRGKVTFGSGTTPAAGAQVVVTFAAAYSAAPTVVLTATTSAAQALGPYVSAVSTTSFTVSTTTAPAASQANTVYGLNFMALG